MAELVFETKEVKGKDAGTRKVRGKAGEPSKTIETPAVAAYKYLAVTGVKDGSDSDIVKLIADQVKSGSKFAKIVIKGYNFYAKRNAAPKVNQLAKLARQIAEVTGEDFASVLAGLQAKQKKG